MKSGPYILALDQGTTSSRALMVDHAGGVLAVSQREYRQIYPKPGWVEHDPMEIWSSQSATMAESLAKAGLGNRDIAAIGITNQRETTVVWDKRDGKPVHNAIVWQDRRTADACAKMKQQGLEAEVSQKTGLRLDPYFSGTKLRWILENVAGARAKAEAGHLLFGTVDSWLVWKLTEGAVHVTDATNASRTLLYNIHSHDWDESMLELFNIPRQMLPEAKGCSEVFGHTPEKVPIAGIAGDQHAALFGQACFELGMAKNTYGTGCFLLMTTGDKAIPSENNLLTTVAWRLGGKTEYALEGSVFMGGAVVQWLRDEMKMVKSAEECSRLAAQVPDTGGLYLVPAFAGLGAPHWDPYARGICVGMTRGTNRMHFCRAALEAIAFQSAELARCMELDSGIEIKQLRVDGGASMSSPLMQFQADLLGVQVVRPENVETTAMGAAYLAGLAVGFWESRDDISARWKEGAQFNPERPVSEMAALSRGWNRAVERAKAWETPDQQS